MCHHQRTFLSSVGCALWVPCRSRSQQRPIKAHPRLRLARQLHSQVMLWVMLEVSRLHRGLPLDLNLSCYHLMVWNWSTPSINIPTLSVITDATSSYVILIPIDLLNYSQLHQTSMIFWLTQSVYPSWIIVHWLIIPFIIFYHLPLYYHLILALECAVSIT